MELMSMTPTVDRPVFAFDSDYPFPILAEVARLQGKVEALSNQLGFVQSKELEPRILPAEIYDSYKIEGEILENLQIYTSFCRRLQVPNISMTLGGPHFEKVVKNLLDALGSATCALPEGGIFAWHTRLSKRPVLRVQYSDFFLGWANKKRAVA